MAAIQTMTIPQFFANSRKTNRNTDDQQDRIFINKMTAHFNKHKIKYRIIGTTILIMLTTADVAFAATTGIDVGGRRIYTKFLQVAKWTIIIRGAWGTINNTLNGDFETAKKSFLQYLMVYVILLALPWALTEVDTVFKDM